MVTVLLYNCKLVLNLLEMLNEAGGEKKGPNGGVHMDPPSTRVSLKNQHKPRYIHSN